MDSKASFETTSAVDVLTYSRQSPHQDEIRAIELGQLFEGVVKSLGLVDGVGVNDMSGVGVVGGGVLSFFVFVLLFSKLVGRLSRFGSFGRCGVVWGVDGWCRFRSFGVVVSVGGGGGEEGISSGVWRMVVDGGVSPLG